MKKKIRILIADDHALVRQGIIAFIQMSDDIEVVCEASDGMGAIEGVKKHKPDIVIMDVAMPALGGLEATIEIKKIDPNIKVLVLTQYEDRIYIRRFLKAGASGYMPKTAVGTDLLTAINAIAGGKAYLHPSIAFSVIDEYLEKKDEAAEDPYEILTDREKQVLKLIAEGYTHKEIADILNISAKTAIAHQTNISEKLDIRSRAALIKFAIQKGIIKIE